MSEIVRVGDRVEVIKGPHKGARGLVSEIEEAAGPFEATFWVETGGFARIGAADDMIRKLSLLEIIAEAAQ